MKSAFPDVKAVIEALGTRAEVATKLQVTDAAVGNWIACNKLPANRYFKIRDLLAPRVVPDKLWAMGRKTPVRRKPAASSDLPQVNTLSGA
jgi:hypothetical protein